MTARRLSHAASLATLGVALTACATLAPPSGSGARGVDGAEAAWARVLATHVLDDGRVDFVALRRDPHDLTAYVAWVAEHGPRTAPARYPTAAARLAYYINAYNALAMYQIVATPRRPEQQIPFFFLTTVTIDGRRTSLYRLEDLVIRPLGEPRVHFALNCMVRGCPRLPREAFDPARLDAQLERETRRFFNEATNVQVDPPLGVVRLNSILRFYQSDFLAEAPSLIAYANRYRDEPIPDGLTVRFIPYDWTLRQR
ncbi:MAG TPA: DUF547 domain-containing protein [Methylomirabilota bacterium]|nr:DUF547 domain-containing protein [Methylomirabilota bacterium]